MAEPINLDELLQGQESIKNEESTQEIENNEINLSPEETKTEDTVIEDSNENLENLQEDQNEVDKEETENLSNDEEVYVETVVKSDEDEQKPDEIETETKEKDLTEYKFKDEFIKKAVDYYEKYGTLQPYLEATQTDYDVLSDADILKAKFDKENADLPAKTRDRLFQKELEKYNLDSFEDEDVELGKALLTRDANKLRQQFKEEQKMFLQSIPERSQEQIESQSITQEQLDIIEQNKSIAREGVGSVLKNNFIKVAANGEGVNFQVADSDKIVDYALDSTKFLATFAKQDGSIDWEKWVKVIAFTENPDLFVGELIKHGKSIGRKALEMELKNFKPEVRSNPIIEEAMGTENPFDDKLGFLKGMKVTSK